MSDSMDGKADTATKHTGNNTYTFPLDPNKTYKFLLTQTNPQGRESFTGAYIISKPSINNVNRDDTIENPPAVISPENNIQLNNTTPPTAPGLNAATAYPIGSSFIIRYVIYATKNGVRYVDNPISGYFHIVEASGKHCVEDYHYAEMLDFAGVTIPDGATCIKDYRLNKHPEVDWMYAIGCGGHDWNVKKAYERSLEGKWKTDEDKYSNNRAIGTYKAAIMYTPGLKSIQEFWGPVEVEYTINICGNYKSIKTPLPSSPLSKTDYYTTRHDMELSKEIAIYADGTPCGVSDKAPDPTIPINITVIPSTAVVYLHHTNSDKKRQHFSAVVLENPGTVVTNRAEWSSDNTTSARVNNDVVKGLAYATLLPGSAAIPPRW